MERKPNEVTTMPPPRSRIHTASPSAGQSSMSSASSATMGRSAIPSHDQVAKRAKAIWESRGRPSGQDETIWLEAEGQLQKEMRSGR